jgi:HEAT repeat protein
MCPPRNWEFWYAIYAEARLLHQWHCGTPSRLATAVEWIVSGREAVVPILSNKSSKEDLRAGRAKLRGLLVSASRRDYQPGRDGVTEAVDGKSIPSLIQLLREGNREDKVRAARSLGLLESQTNLIVPALADAVRNDPSGTVRICAAETLLLIGQDAKTALPAIEASLNDPRMAQRRDVLLRLAEVREKLK